MGIQRQGRFGSVPRMFMRILVVVALLATVLAAGGSGPASAATSELFLSEYIEGSSFNKAVEIYNGTGAPVDLGAGGYTLELYSNGSPTPSQTVALNGTVAAGDVFVVAHGSADPAILAQVDLTSSTVVNFNGDDGVVLRKSGAVIDAFGQQGVDPGSEWPGGGQDDTLRRKVSVCAGDTDFSDAFNASVEWDSFALNTFGGLGSHAAVCEGGVGDPVINEFSASTTGADVEYIEVVGTANTDYSAFTVLEIEGDSGRGNIDRVFPVGTTGGGGFWTTVVGDLSIENGTITLLLVEGFTGAAGSDIDTDDNGVIDFAPWTRIVDDVAVSDGGAGDLTYSSSTLFPNYDGLSGFAPGGASRIPDGTDTDTIADWARNDFDLFGIPGFPGSPLIGEARNTPGATNVLITTFNDPEGVCGDPATMIHDIQGAGAASTDVGNIREIEGVVVGDFQGSTGLNGFNVQEEDSQADANPLTSEGIFVFDPSTGVAVDVGDVVRVRGTVTEFNGLTEINNVVTVLDCGATGTATAATVLLPVSALDDFEAFEGMAVNLPQTLFATGNFTQARFGEVDLAVGGAQDNPTNVVAPGAPAIALQDLNDRSRIQLDDGSTVQNPLPLPPYLGVDNTLRTGDSVAGLTGVMSYSFGFYEIHPTSAVDFTRLNNRTGPPSVGGTIQVAAYNVLNYFTTIDTGAAICGPLANQDCRGADTASELTRQRDKLVTAISTLDAEVVGLMEIENHPGDVPTADLVAALNAATAPGTYAYIATGAVGIDAIRQAILYKPAAVTPVGAFEVLDSSDSAAFDDTLNRPMIVQTFQENATGAIFTVAVNHLKSKGSDCVSVGDPDLGDGQGNCNLTRTRAAQAIVDYLATDPTGSGDGDFLIIGDLNAYAMEDPVTTLEAGGYLDLVESFVGTGFGAGAYSFNFLGQSGYLDHGLASASMASQVVGAAFWHVNTDEPAGLDYNNFNQPGLYNANEYRSSDHDPVVIGLQLGAPTCQGLAATIIGTPGDDVIVGTNQDDVILGLAGNDIIMGDNGKDVICAGHGDDTVDGGNGKDVLDGGPGNDTGDGGNGNDACVNFESAVSCEL